MSCTTSLCDLSKDELEIIADHLNIQDSDNFRISCKEFINLKQRFFIGQCIWKLIDDFNDEYGYYNPYWEFGVICKIKNQNILVHFKRYYNKKSVSTWINTTKSKIRITTPLFNNKYHIRMH